MKSTAPATFNVPPAGGAARVVQIHPSLQCNLTCGHCYSGSAPTFKGALAVNRLKQVLEELAGAGYNAIALSGGEPFLYRPLEELLTHSHSLGYFNSITTNAMLLGSERAKKVLAQTDLIAISVDGKEEEHDAVRNFPGAFKKMQEGVRIVKDYVPAFGFIHTVFPQDWRIMHWLVQFALEHEAKLLHLHPLEMAGRAAKTFRNVTFSTEDLHKIFVAFHYLKEAYSDRLFMQLDLLHRDYILHNPAFMFHQSVTPDFTAANFSAIFKELIIDEDGDILPVSHGCAKHFKIGNIYEGVCCATLIDRFMEEKAADVQTLYKATHDFIAEHPETELINWSEAVIDVSHQLFDVQLMALCMRKDQSELA